MSDALIVEALRTPRGHGRPGGSLAGLTPLALTTQLARELLETTGCAPELVDDVRLGISSPTGAQGTDLARLVALEAGLPQASGGVVSRFCCSGLDAIASAAAQVRASMESVVMAGGVESMSAVPLFADGGPWFSDPHVAERTGFMHMAVSADLLATLEGIERPELDALAARSHQRAAAAWEQGRYARSVRPVYGDDGEALLSRDELIRPDLDEAAMAARDPSFEALNDEAARRRIAATFPDLGRVEPLHHTRSAPGLADCAALTLVTDAAGAQAVGARPRARVLSWAHVAAEPAMMLSGNAAAVRLALRRAGLEVSDVDRFEVNESFAAVPIHFARALGVSHERLNVFGGAIAMGHPLGATGGVLIATLLEALEHCDGAIGVASVCGGAGVASAVVLERL